MCQSFNNTCKLASSSHIKFALSIAGAFQLTWRDLRFLCGAICFNMNKRKKYWKKFLTTPHLSFNSASRCASKPISSKVCTRSSWGLWERRRKLTRKRCPKDLALRSQLWPCSRGGSTKQSRPWLHAWWINSELISSSLLSNVWRNSIPLYPVIKRDSLSLKREILISRHLSSSCPLF